MANTDGPKGFKFVMRLGGGAGELKRIALAASQTIAKGDALEASSGTAIIATATSGALLGVAAEAVTSGTAGAGVSYIKYYPAMPDYVFEGQTSGTYAAASDDMTTADIEGTTGIMEINEDATVEDVVQILKMAPNSAAGANAKVRFIIVRSSYLPLLAAQ